MCYDEDDEYIRHGSKNFNAPSGVHIMNKNESKTLRNLKRKTGLTEVEIRKEKKFRIILSEAQKKKGNKTEEDRWIINRVKSVTKKVGLAVQHPTFKEELQKELDKVRTRFLYIPSSYPTTAETVIQRYLHLRKKK